MNSETEQLANALRAILDAYCGDAGLTPEDCRVAERQANQALASIEEAALGRRKAKRG
jgi:hypothetical protein